jgi:hypothetical protein
MIVKKVLDSWLSFFNCIGGYMHNQPYHTALAIKPKIGDIQALNTTSSTLRPPTIDSSSAYLSNVSNKTFIII